MQAVNSGQFTKALELLDRARASASDPDLSTRIELTAAYAEAETGSPTLAVQRCEAALRDERLHEVTVGLVHSQLGLLRMRAGDVPEALEHFTQAAALLRNDDQHLGRVFINRGGIHLQLGDAVAAAMDFREASVHFAAAGDPVEGAKASFNLGYAEMLRGDMVTALRRMDEASPVLSALSDAYRASVEQDRAEVLLAAGRSRDATTALESAAEAYGVESLRRFQAECELVLARTLLHEDASRSRQVARSAARHFVSQESRTWALRAEAQVVIAEITLGAKGPRIRDRADNIAARLRRMGHRRDADQLALHTARLVLRRGELEDATSRLKRIRTTDDTPIGTRLLAREVKAELAKARGHFGRARQQAREGLADLHAWQSSFGSLDLQSTMVGHGNALARIGLELALADGSPTVVFEWSERARALASRVTTLRPPPDPQLAADLTALRLLDPKETAKARELRERIRSQSWYAAEGSVGEPVGLDALQARLADDNAALVAHIVLDDRLTALVATGEDATVVPLSDAPAVREQLDRIAADLDFAAHNPSGSFGQTVRASLDEELSRVADMLVTPLLDLIGDRRVVLTPSALLAGTPWTLLPGLQGRPVTVPTSATRWLELVAQPRGEPARIGLVAGPRVERAVDEITRAAAAWAAVDLLEGDDANAAKVGEVAARVDVLHLAGHGVHAGDHPLFSAVELADGPWFGHDIDLLPHTPSVVVLSACELGQASVLHGEESVGMTAAWLHAGARAVLSSPALVADEVACDALAHWHRLVAAGAAPAEALAEVVAETDGVVPFVCFGAGW